MRCPQRQLGAVGWGFAVALAVAAALCLCTTAVMFSASEAEGTVGLALHEEISGIAAAMQRARLDANCFPLRLDALVDAAKGHETSCGIDARSTLRTPYLSGAEFDARGAIRVHAGGGRSTVRVVQQEAIRGGEVSLVVQDVPIAAAVAWFGYARRYGAHLRFWGSTVGDRLVVSVAWVLK